MQTIDWLTIGIILVSILLGVLVGFGRGLRWVSKGIVGIVLSVFFCYTFGGLILGIPFVGDLLRKFASLWDKPGGFYDFLKVIHLEIVLYYIILFVLAQLIRHFIVKLISRAFEWDNKVMKVINRVLGAVLFLAINILLVLFVFQIVNWVGGESAANFEQSLKGVFCIDRLFVKNPMNSIIDLVKNSIK